MCCVFALGACVPFAAPPLRAESGGAYNTGRAAPREKVSIGAHLASAWHGPDVPLDIGAGYVRNGFASHDGLLEDPGHAAAAIATAYGSGFDVGTGEVVHGPATAPAIRFESRVAGEQVEVRLVRP